MKQSGENVDYSWPCKDHINLLLWAIKQPVALTSDLFFPPVMNKLVLLLS